MKVLLPVLIGSFVGAAIVVMALWDHRKEFGPRIRELLGIAPKEHVSVPVVPPAGTSAEDGVEGREERVSRVAIIFAATASLLTVGLGAASGSTALIIAGGVGVVIVALFLILDLVGNQTDR